MNAGAEAQPPARPDIPMRPLDGAAIAAARKRQAQLVKPAGALGRLEELAIWLAGATGSARPQVVPRVVIAAADHGVAHDEAISAYPPAVTGQMLRTFLRGEGAITALAAEVGASLRLVDAGVDPATAPSDAEIVRVGIAPSANLAEGAALMTPQVAAAVDCGRELAAEAAADGVTVLVGGEMGIGNTTAATCLAAALLDRDGAELVGPGTGLDEAGMARKREVVTRALALHQPKHPGPLGWLRRVGGGEIAVLCGLALGAGEHGMAYVCDGLIATVGAAVAVAIEPELRPRLLAGHISTEPAHAALLAHLELEPVVDLGMRLGEGSGAVAALALLRLACAAHDGMATFAEAGVAGPAS